MITGFTPRLYQETIFATCSKHNTLVVLPTGMGKSNIFLMLAAHRLKHYPNSKVMILAPTKPLCQQHLGMMRDHLDIDPDKIVLFTGMVSPAVREQLWKEAKVIISTPQGLENDIISRRVDLSDVSLLTFDEAHRAVKDYAYVWIANQYDKLAKHSRILGLTASPGSDKQTIEEVCKNLHVEEIEVRGVDDPDVRPYVQETEVDWIEVELPDEFRDIQRDLQACFKSKLDEVKNYGILSGSYVTSKKEILSLQASLHAQIAAGNKHFTLLKSVSLLAEAMKVQHGIELLETQGIGALLSYMKGLQSKSVSSKVKATKNLVKDRNFHAAVAKTILLAERQVEHPKIPKLMDIIRQEDKSGKIIIFTQYRDSGSKIVEEANKVPGIEARLFVGQMKKKGTGMSQKEQIEMIEEFSSGEFNTIVMTSVGEEGLDIPSVDLVIFYEPIPSAIRHIQRRGRTGRHSRGRVLVLLAKNTRDEGYRWSAHHKEKRMYRTLRSFKTKLIKQPTLERYVPKDTTVILVDHREKGSGIIKQLIELGANIKLERLEHADYVLSPRVSVELKTVADFVDSLIDKRIFQQLKNLCRNAERPLLVVEGTADIYSQRNVHANAIRGLIGTIAVDFGVPIVYTKDAVDTAALFWIIAKREQLGKGEDFSVHSDKKIRSLKEMQEYIISSLPQVGPNTAKSLLKQFGSVTKVVNAEPGKLKEIDKIGNKKAEEIRKVLDSLYE